MKELFKNKKDIAVQIIMIILVIVLASLKEFNIINGILISITMIISHLIANLQDDSKRTFKLYTRKTRTENNGNTRNK